MFNEQSKINNVQALSRVKGKPKPEPAQGNLRTFPAGEAVFYDVFITPTLGI